MSFQGPDKLMHASSKHPDQNAFSSSSSLSGVGLALLLLGAYGCSDGTQGANGGVGGGSSTGGAAGGISGSSNAAGAPTIGGTGALGGFPASAGSAGGISAGGAPSGGTSNGVGGVGGGAGGAPTPLWGLDSRPANQTCKAPPARNQAAALLSMTGCADPTDPKKPAASLIPYDVVSPLWSDGAEKLRYFALPDGTTIALKDCERDASACASDTPLRYLDDGDWIFPDGTVFVKTFALGGRLIETRLLVKIDRDNWWGYSYEWRADQTDADLLAANTDGYERPIQTSNGTQVWHFPSRAQCLQCHTDGSGGSIGPETVQLNSMFVYPNGARGNQIETLVHAGLFAPGQEPSLDAGLASPTDTSQPLEVRARSYLHANCGNCHRPGAVSSTNIDLRFQTSLSDTKTCNEAPEKGDFGVEALRITPGDPDKSTLSIRMHTLDTMQRMPRIGTRVVDAAGVGVVDEWIRSLTGCL